MDAEPGPADAAAALLATLAQFEWLQNLDPDALIALAGALVSQELAPGATLFRAGEVGSSLYLVVSGRLNVLLESEPGIRRSIAEAGAGGCVGEMAVLTGGRRTASVEALEPTRVLELTRAQFQQAVLRTPAIREVLGRLVMQRLSALRLLESGLLAGMSTHVEQVFARHVSWLQAAAGDWVFRLGDPADAVHILVHGRVALFNERDEMLSILGPGETIGPLSLGLAERRVHHARALRDSDLLRIPAAAFEDVLTRDPAAVVLLMRRMAAQRVRLDQDTRAEAERRRNPRIALIAASANAVKTAENLVQVLSEHGRVLALDAAHYDQLHGSGAAQLPPEDPRSFFLRDWLELQERSQDHIVLMAGGDDGHWLQTCVRQADRVVVLAEAGDPEGLRALAAAIGPTTAATSAELVLLHAAGVRPGPAPGSPFANGAFQRRHNVRLGHRSDLQRIARFLSGTAVGLVLGAGGARAFAHVGVFKALLDHGIAVDCVGGASMGALIGALIAADLPVPEVISVLRHMLVDRPRGLQLTLPVLSVMSLARAEARFREVFGEARIEEQWLQSFAISVNLTQGVQTVHDSGVLWEAVRASIAIPGVFSPLFANGEVLVDGALINSLPVDIMRSYCPGPVIACDVNRSDALRASSNCAPTPPLRELLLGRLGIGRSKGLPGITAVLLRALEVTTLQFKRRNAALASCYLTPPVADYRVLDMRPLDALVEAGYRYTSRRLEQDPDELAALLAGQSPSRHPTNPEVSA
jgi:predicted acylesterase/phospholipase RssA/CRP-like cAMP-binding protein